MKIPLRKQQGSGGAAVGTPRQPSRREALRTKTLPTWTNEHLKFTCPRIINYHTWLNWLRNVPTWAREHSRTTWQRLPEFRRWLNWMNGFLCLNRARSSTKHPAEIPLKHLPFVLRKMGLIIQLLVQIAILVTVIILWILSITRNGFVSVPDTPSSFASRDQNKNGTLLWTYTLLWTTIPTWLMNGYGALYLAMLSSLQSCQPTMELTKPAREQCATYDRYHRKSVLPCFDKRFHKCKTPLNERSTIKSTLMLDYSQYFPIINASHAFGNRHLLVAFCMLISTSISVMGGLAAAVISIAVVPTNTTITLSFETYFHDNTLNESSRPALDIVSANLVHGGEPYSWTTQNSSFLPFRAVDGSPSGNISGHTQAFSSTLDCVSFPPQDLDMTLIGSANLTLHFNFTDRGCPVTIATSISPTSINFGKTWTFTTDPLECTSERFGIITGNYDTTSSFLLANFTFLSCIPSFFNSTASVVVSDLNTTDSSSQVLSSTLSNAIQFSPFLSDIWLDNLPYYQIYEPINVRQMDTLADITYNYALKQNPNSPFDTTLITSSFQTVYSAVFAAFATTSLYLPLTHPTTSKGTLLRPQNRLFVVRDPAIVILLIVCISLLTTIWVWFYVKKNEEILKQNLDFILGHAILVEKSEELKGFLGEVRESVRGQGNRVEDVDLVDYAAKNGFGEWECWLDKETVRLRRPEAPAEPGVPEAPERLEGGNEIV